MITGMLPRLCAAVLAAGLLAGCERRSDLADPPVDLGPFDLGLNIVVADNAEKVPISRDATPEEWESALTRAVEDRFGRYDGARFYNIGINVDGYALAPPGIPLVVTPQSVLVITASIWDDERQQRLSGPGKQFTIFESVSGETVIGSGLTRSKREQMDALAYNAAKAIETWFLENPQWFGEGIPVPDPPGERSTAAAAVPPPPGPAAPEPATPAPAPAPAAVPVPAAAPAPAPAPAGPAVPQPALAPGDAALPALPGGALYPETP
jgi:hypothetical protein